MLLHITAKPGHEEALLKGITDYHHWIANFEGHSEEEPTFYEIMTKELGGEEQFETFMNDWSESFKVGHSAMLKYLPDASDYGNE